MGDHKGVGEERKEKRRERIAARWQGETNTSIVLLLLFLHGLFLFCSLLPFLLPGSGTGSCEPIDNRGTERAVFTSTQHLATAHFPQEVIPAFASQLVSKCQVEGHVRNVSSMEKRDATT